MEKLAKEDIDGRPEEKAELEKKGKYDITHSIQSFNKGRTIARTFCVLCKWLKKDMALLQDAKDREERTGGKPAMNPKQAPVVNYYFGQQRQPGQGNFNRFGGGRGIPQGGGGFRRQFATNGAPQQGRRPGGANTRQFRPNKHPDSEEALAKWKGMKGLGPEAKPMTKDCPLKCSHAIPYGNALWHETFKNYEPSMKLDVIEKNNLCRFV